MSFSAALNCHEGCAFVSQNNNTIMRISFMTHTSRESRAPVIARD